MIDSKCEFFEIWIPEIKDWLDCYGLAVTVGEWVFILYDGEGVARLVSAEKPRVKYEGMSYDINVLAHEGGRMMFSLFCKRCAELPPLPLGDTMSMSRWT